MPHPLLNFGNKRGAVVGLRLGSGCPSHKHGKAAPTTWRSKPKGQGRLDWNFSLIRYERMWRSERMTIGIAPRYDSVRNPTFAMA